MLFAPKIMTMIDRGGKNLARFGISLRFWLDGIATHSFRPSLGMCIKFV